jgi:hypothetical protein
MPPEKNNPAKAAPKSQTTSFEKSMQQYAKNYPEAYKSVLEKWNLTTAKGIVDQGTQQGLVAQIEATIDAMEGVPA